jgi:hypothetical protein
LQRHAEKSADEDDQAENDDVIEGGSHNNSADDVASYKELEPQQNGTSQILTIQAKEVTGLTTPLKKKSSCCDERTDDDHGYASGIHGSANNVHDFSKSHYDQGILSTCNGHVDSLSLKSRFLSAL